ncbi:MAG: protoporphyrinogen oxidase [Xanthomonadales bacterium]|nr:protoporphyrinogen oxidase [Xanthomonadales bacterium]
MKVVIVGAGISGLATAKAIRLRDPDAEIVMLEAGERPGGKVWTEMSPEGYLCEWGVNGFLDKSEQTRQLCEAAGVKPLPSDDSAKRRYVYSEGRLHKLPEKPPEFLASKLLSTRGKLRVLAEIFAGGSDVDDETLAAFGTRRLGREAFEKLIDPMASGVFAGDAATMSLKSCFPRIREIEEQYGSLIRGLIRLQFAARRAGSKNTPGPGPGGTLTSFADGMSVLTDALVNQLGPRVRLNSAVSGISREGPRYTVYLEDGRQEEADALVVAAPAWAQTQMLADLSPALAGRIAEIPYPPVTVVCLGYNEERIGGAPDGFGFLVPSRERRAILGTVVDSNVFPGRAPDGFALLRTLVGGARTPKFAELPKEQLLDRVLQDLGDILDLRVEPDFVGVFRHERAIPQYRVGHARRLRDIEEKLTKFPGLVLSGNAYRGVSLNDCVANAFATAHTMIPKSRSVPQGGGMR